MTPVAHNTVVVNGNATYNEKSDPNRQMIVASAEPASQKAALSPHISFARASFRYTSPQAEQSRTLALIRIGPKTGFYFDVFRSRAQNEAGSFHDYFYHNMGQSLTVTGSDRTPLVLSRSSTFSNQPGLMKAYGYLKNEKSVGQTSDLHATFTMTLPDGTSPTMALWMPAQTGRTLFTVDAPANNAIRDALPAEVRSLPMPTLIVRQTGEAWNRPFISVYEPFLAAEGASVRSVHAAKMTEDAPTLAASVVEGIGYRVLLFQDADPSAPRQTDLARFQGDFGAVIERSNSVDELYLGNGETLSAEGLTLQSADGKPVSASLRREGSDWRYSADRPVTITLPRGKAVRMPAAQNALVRPHS